MDRRTMLKSAAAMTAAPLGLISAVDASASSPAVVATLAGELSRLQEVIDQHRAAYDHFGAVSPFMDEIDERYDPARRDEFEAADQAETKALARVIEYRVETLSVLAVKARYLAEIDNMGSLNYEQAYEFLHAVAQL